MIRGIFVSSKGTRWNYEIDVFNIADVWHPTIKRTTGGWKEGRDKYMNPLTKEFKKYIKDQYGIEVR